MPTTTIFDTFFIGTLTIIDPTEGNTTAENASVLVGQTFGSLGDPLVDHIETLRDWDVGEPDYSYYKQDLNVNDDTFRNLTTNQVQTFDAVAAYNATITYMDGTTASYVAAIFQDDAGKTYIVPPSAAGPDLDALEAGPIRSITFDSLAGNNFIGGSKSREDLEFVTCFAAGTQISTQQGRRLIEELQPGGLVQTIDHGVQPVRWMKRTTCWAKGKFAPVSFRSGCLGRGRPDQDLLVSQQHRVLVSSKIVERELGYGDVLVPAIHLVGFPGIEIADDNSRITYVHILFDRHELVLANGSPTESLYLGHMVCNSLGARERLKLRSSLYQETDNNYPAIRPILTGPKRRRILGRHKTNNQPLLQTFEYNSAGKTGRDVCLTR